MLKEKCDALGVECFMQVVGRDIPDETSVQFIERIFSQ